MSHLLITVGGAEMKDFRIDATPNVKPRELKCEMKHDTRADQIFRERVP